MTPSGTFSPQLILLVMPFILGLLGIAIHVQLARPGRFHDLTRAFANSVALPRLIKLWRGKTLHSRMSVVAGLAGLVVFSSRCIKRGLLDKKDFSNLPRDLKYRLLLSAYLIFTGFVWLMTNAAINRLCGG